MREPQFAQMRISSPGAEVWPDEADVTGCAACIGSRICLAMADIGERIGPIRTGHGASPALSRRMRRRICCQAQPAPELEGSASRLFEEDFYKVLQVDPEADEDVIAAAHKALARKLHPETDLTGVHEIRKAALDRAFAVLSDYSRRRQFDLQRESQMVAMGPGHANGNGHGHEEMPRLAHGALTERVQAGIDGANLASMKLDFGRYAGWTLGDLARQDPDYLRWLSRHSSGLRYRSAILRLLAQEASRTPLHVQP
jgi:hypothetical protein